MSDYYGVLDDAARYRLAETALPVVPPVAPPVVTEIAGPPDMKPATAVDGLADHVARLRQIGARIKELSAEADQIKAAIQDALGDYEVGTVHGLPAVTWTRHTRHALDQKAFREACPELYRHFLKASTVRRFTLNEEIDQ